MFGRKLCSLLYLIRETLPTVEMSALVKLEFKILVYIYRKLTTTRNSKTKRIRDILFKKQTFLISSMNNQFYVPI